MWIESIIAGLLAATAVCANTGGTSSKLENICRLSRHQSTVIGDRLYIMGGRAEYETGNGVTTAPNTFIRYISLSTSFPLRNGTSSMLRYSITSDVPEISQGQLWPDNDQLVLVGGKTETVNSSVDGYTPPSDANEVWRYESKQSGGDGLWLTESVGGDAVLRTYDGAGTYVAALRKGFLLGGLVSEESMAGIGEGERAVGGLLVWDIVGGTWKNITTTPWETRHSARSFLLPYGRQGALIVIGGVRGNNQVFSFNEIAIYDIAADRWYQQSATGDTPEHRRHFCGQVASSPDGSSHQIYIFGGSNAAGDLTNAVHVLSIPTFEWTTASAANSTDNSDAVVPSAREWASCDLVAGHYMMVYGGDFQGNTSTCNMSNMYVFDLALWRWRDSFNSAIVSYSVPAPIVSAIGGSSTGGATKTQPSNGFNDPALGLLLTGNTPNTTTSSRSPHPATKPSVIAGIVASATFGIASIVGGMILYRRRKRKSQASEIPASEIPAESQVKHDESCDWEPQELPMPVVPVDVMRLRAELYGSSNDL